MDVIKQFRGLIAALQGSAVVGALRFSNNLASGAVAFVAFGSQGIAAGVAAALVTGTLGTLLCSLVSRTPAEIVGTHVSLTLVYAALGAHLILSTAPGGSLIDIIAGLSLAVVLMGFIQILAAWARLGSAVKFLPFPVNAGFMTGAGLLLIWSQLGVLMGLDGQLTKYNWGELLHATKPWTLFLGICLIGVVWMVPRLTKKLHPLLVALVLGILGYHALNGFVPTDALSPTVGTFSIWEGAQVNFGHTWHRINLDWFADMVIRVLPFSAFLALQGTMFAALCAASLAETSDKPPNVNGIILAQGLGNVFCGLLGALPMTSGAGISNVANKMRHIRGTVPILSDVLLVVVLLFFGSLLALVPLVVLGVMVIFIGIGLIDSWTRDMLVRVVRGKASDRRSLRNVIVVSAVSLSMFFGSVQLALSVGVVLALILMLIEMSSSTTLGAQVGSAFASRRVWPTRQLLQLQQDRASIRVFRPRGGLFFANADQLSEQLRVIDSEARFCVIDLSLVSVIDLTGCRIINASAKKLAERGIKTVLAGIDPASLEAKGYIDLGLHNPSPIDCWFRDIDHAMEQIEIQLLKLHSLEVATNNPVPLEHTQITETLSTGEVAALLPYLVNRNLEAKQTLFKRGDAGSSIYIVSSGLIEIRVDAEQSTNSWRRMAVLGPGCIFGEIALLTGGYRSADAVCAESAVLIEITKDSLDALSQKLPDIHRKILTNLNVHLALRVVAATEVIRIQ